MFNHSKNNATKIVKNMLIFLHLDVNHTLLTKKLV